MKLIFSFLLSFHFLRPRSIYKHLQKLIYSSLYVKKDIAYDRKFSIVVVSVVISPEWVHLSTSAHKTGYMLLRANNKRRRSFCSPSKTLTEKKLLIRTPQSITYLFYYPLHNALLDVWKRGKQLITSKKSLHDSLGTKIYAT